MCSCFFRIIKWDPYYGGSARHTIVDDFQCSAGRSRFRFYMHQGQGLLHPVGIRRAVNHSDFLAIEQQFLPARQHIIKIDNDTSKEKAFFAFRSENGFFAAKITFLAVDRPAQTNLPGGMRGGHIVAIEEQGRFHTCFVQTGEGAGDDPQIFSVAQDPVPDVANHIRFGKNFVCSVRILGEIFLYPAFSLEGNAKLVAFVGQESDSEGTQVGWSRLRLDVLEQPVAA